MKTALLLPLLLVLLTAYNGVGYAQDGDADKPTVVVLSAVNQTVATVNAAIETPAVEYNFSASTLMPAIFAEPLLAFTSHPQRASLVAYKPKPGRCNPGRDESCKSAIVYIRKNEKVLSTKRYLCSGLSIT